MFDLRERSLHAASCLQVRSGRRARTNRREFLAAAFAGSGACTVLLRVLAPRSSSSVRSTVISGDTAPSDNLVELARGADVLVHSVMYPAAIDRLVGRVPNAGALKQSILAHQTSAQDPGRIAQKAGVNALVLSHLVPADDPEVTDEMWMQAATCSSAEPSSSAATCWNSERALGALTFAPARGGIQPPDRRRPPAPRTPRSCRSGT